MSKKEIKNMLNSFRTFKKIIILKRKILNDYIEEVHRPLMQILSKLDCEKSLVGSTYDILYFSTLITEILKEDIKNAYEKLEKIYALLTIVNDVEQHVLYQKYVCGMKWTAVGDTLNFSERQVQRIADKALNKISAHLQCTNTAC